MAVAEAPKHTRLFQSARSGNVVMLRPPATAIEDPAAVAAWVRNMRADPSVLLKLGRHTFSGVARELNDSAELELARRALCDTVHLVDYGECRLHLRGLPTRKKIKALHRYWFDTGIPIAIDLSTGQQSALLHVAEPP